MVYVWLARHKWTVARSVITCSPVMFATTQASYLILRLIVVFATMIKAFSGIAKNMNVSVGRILTISCSQMAKRVITNLKANVQNVQKYSVFVKNAKQVLLNLQAPLISSTGKARRHPYPHFILSARNAVMVVSMTLQRPSVKVAPQSMDSPVNIAMNKDACRVRMATIYPEEDARVVPRSLRIVRNVTQQNVQHVNQDLTYLQTFAGTTCLKDDKIVFTLNSH